MKNLNASKPSEHPPSGEKLSKGLGGNIGYCRDKNFFMVSKGFPDLTKSDQQYSIREKPSVILYTYINHHARTPKPQSRNIVSLGVQYNLT